MVLFALGSDRRWLVTVSVDNRIKVWDTVSGQLVHQYAEPNHLAAQYTCVDILPSATEGKDAAMTGLVAVGSQSGVIVIWDLARARILHRLGASSSGANGHAQQVNDVKFSPNGKQLFSCSEDKTILAWDLSTGKVIKSVRAGKQPVQRLCVRPDGAALLAAASGIKLYDLSSYQVLQKYSGHASPVTDLAFSPDGRYFVSSATLERFAHLWATAGSEAKMKKSDEDQEKRLRPVSVLPLDSRGTRFTFHPNFKNSFLGGRDTDPTSYVLSGVTEANLGYVWTWQDNLAESLSPACAVTLRQAKDTSAGVEVLLQLAFHEDRLVIIHGTGMRPFFKTERFINQDGIKKRIDSTPVSYSLTLVDTASSGVARKRKAASMVLDPSDSVIPVVAGRAQATADSTDANLEPKQKQRRLAKGADSEQSLQDRMQSQALSSPRGPAALPGVGQTVSDKVKALLKSKPTAASLQIVVSQALHTSDDVLLEYCLDHTVSVVIQRTVDRLPTVHVLPFLLAIVHKLETRPSRSIKLTPWINAILSRHAGYLASLPDLPQKLSTLYYVLETRLSALQPLLAIQGRLELLLSTMDAAKRQAKEAEEALFPASVPLVVFDEAAAAAPQAGKAGSGKKKAAAGAAAMQVDDEEGDDAAAEPTAVTGDDDAEDEEEKIALPAEDAEEEAPKANGKRGRKSRKAPEPEPDSEAESEQDQAADDDDEEDDAAAAQVGGDDGEEEEAEDDEDA